MPTKISFARAAAHLCQIGMVLAVFNAAFLVAGNHPSRSWPSVRGNVLDVTFAGTVSPGWKGAGGVQILKRYRVNYDYVVDGRRYEGVDHLPQRPEKGVEVYYQPGNPQASGLVRGADLFAVCASFAIAFSLWICGIGFRGAARAA